VTATDLINIRPIKFTLMSTGAAFGGARENFVRNYSSFSARNSFSSIGNKATNPAADPIILLGSDTPFEAVLENADIDVTRVSNAIPHDGLIGRAG
jgi:hypothetical protein